MTAAADFSMFGGSLDDDPLSVNSGGGGGGGRSGAFDLGDMSEAARKFEEDFRRAKSSGNGIKHEKDSDGDDGGDKNGEENNYHVVNPSRPLASEGTTIRSGSGDDVNVFEDFEDPDSTMQTSTSTTAKSKDGGSNNEPSIKSGDEQSASSRLMQMIGVSNDANEKEDTNEDANATDNIMTSTETTLPSTTLAPFMSFSSGISKNPWGEPAPISSTSVSNQKELFGLDLAAKLRESSNDQLTGSGQNDATAAADRLRREEIERMRLLEEEAKRRATLLAQQQQQQQQAELLLRQQQAAEREQQQKQASQQGPSQVELILTERISTILENSWGRSNLMSVLSTLHSEDPRVVQLLGNVDALRALIARHTRRFALANDPTYGTEMAVLLMNNATWQQQQQADELRRRQEEHQKMIAARQQEAARIEAEQRAKEASSQRVVVTDSPWYYADPQGNVQVSKCYIIQIMTLSWKPYYVSQQFYAFWGG